MITLKSLSALLLGSLFGLGLIVSQMVNPQKVINFLDVFGHWDPSLAFVMMGALIVFGMGYRLIIMPRAKPIWAEVFALPVKTMLEPKLLIGAAIFGIGWGLLGICPGPAMVNLMNFDVKMIAFIVAMLMGMKLAHKIG